MNYRGYEIEKFYSEELVPSHIIRTYYQEEKTRIDRLIQAEEKRKSAKANGFVEESITDAINDFIDNLNLI